MVQKLQDQNGIEKDECLYILKADIDYATSEALTTYGILGVKVWIYRGDKGATT